MEVHPPASGLARAGRSLLLSIALGCGLVTGLHQANAGADDQRVTLSVVDTTGAPLDQAIVWAVPLSGQKLPAAVGLTAEIEQRSRAFTPGVLPVRVGTAVSFPNNDTVRHQVYSFSPAKVFSLKLYIGTPAEPVVFDKPGEITLGCNIHDGMLAYVMALETPYFAKTGADGRADLDGLVPGDYELKSWHPTQKAASASQRIRVEARAAAAGPYRFVTETAPKAAVGRAG